MARPKKYRRVLFNPACYYFKPKGIPMHNLKEIILENDELEAIRLGDMLKLSQEKAAKKMRISRQTFGRIVNSAHEKIADGILNGKAIKILENVNSELRNGLWFICLKCGFKRRIKYRSETVDCPNCNN